jgi:hypothetical protein
VPVQDSRTRFDDYSGHLEANVERSALMSTFSVIPTEVEESLIVFWPLRFVATEIVRDVSTSLDMTNWWFDD